MHQGSDSILDSPGQGTDSLPVTPKSSICILYNNNSIFSIDLLVNKNFFTGHSLFKKNKKKTWKNLSSQNV